MSGTWVRCSLCHGNGSTAQPRKPDNPLYLKAWPHVKCEKCGGTGVDAKKTKELPKY